MGNREAPSMIVPRVVADDGSGHSRPALCPLCNGSMTNAAVTWYSLPSDPEGLRRCVHSFCAHEHAKFLRAVGYADRAVTPAF